MNWCLLKRGWFYLRPVLGWFCLFIGILGIILPILQGMPFLILGITLLNRDKRIRWTSVHMKLLIRQWASSSHTTIRTLGTTLLKAQQEISRQRRRFAWKMMDWQQQFVQKTPQIGDC